MKETVDELAEKIKRVLKVENPQDKILKLQIQIILNDVALVMANHNVITGAQFLEMSREISNINLIK